VDGFDRGGGAARPAGDLFEQFAGAVRQGQRTRVGLQCRQRAAVEQQRLLATGGERQVQRQADRPGADDQDVDIVDGRISHGA
jgi:hypothetical protein